MPAVLMALLAIQPACPQIDLFQIEPEDDRFVYAVYVNDRRLETDVFVNQLRARPGQVEYESRFRRNTTSPPRRQRRVLGGFDFPESAFTSSAIVGYEIVPDTMTGFEEPMSLGETRRFTVRASAGSAQSDDLPHAGAFAVFYERCLDHPDYGPVAELTYERFTFRPNSANRLELAHTDKIVGFAPGLQWFVYSETAGTRLELREAGAEQR